MRYWLNILQHVFFPYTLRASVIAAIVFNVIATIVWYLAYGINTMGVLIIGAEVYIFGMIVDKLLLSWHTRSNKVLFRILKVGRDKYVLYVVKPDLKRQTYEMISEERLTKIISYYTGRFSGYRVILS